MLKKLKIGYSTVKKDKEVGVQKEPKAQSWRNREGSFCSEDLT